jgi:SAM-dependent methyltransferase
MAMRGELIGGVTRAHDAWVFPRRLNRLVQTIAPLLPEQARVLDVGCGDGSLDALLGAARPDVQIEGIDVLVRTETAFPVTPFDGRSIPFEDGAFDAVITIDVLHHAEDAETLLLEAARVARDAIVVKDHYRDGFAAETTLRFMDWVGNRGHGVALPYHYRSRREWEALFQQLGLAVERLETALHLYPPPFSWVFDRGLHFVALLK